MTIPESVAAHSPLRKGLYALAQAYGRKIDEDTVKLWAYAARDLTVDQWRHGVDTIIRSPQRFFPAPGVVIEAAYSAPPPPRALPAIRPTDQFWESPAQASHVLDAVRHSPKGTREGVFEYIRRIAVMSGLANPEKGEEVSAIPHVSDGRSLRTETLIYEEESDGYRDSDNVAAGETDGD